MKHTSLITCLLLCTAHISHAMETIAKKSVEPSDATQKCLKAIKKGNPAKVKLALLEGADVNYTNNDGKSLFYLAREKHNIELLKLLITHENIDLFTRDKEGSIPFDYACRLGLTSTVESMLRKNTQVSNTYDIMGSTPLQTAASFGKTACIELLLSYNSSTIDCQDYEGDTALHYACFAANCNTVKLLIEKGANTTIQNNNQRTPLVALCVQFDDNNRWNVFDSFLTDNPAIEKKLIYAKDKNNNNQFHLSAELEISNDYHVVQKYLTFLSSRGLNKQARNKQGKRPVDLACDEYNARYNHYLAKKIDLRKKELTNQERIMHAFLCFTSPDTSCVLFKAMLEQASGDNTQLPKELIAHIMSYYYALNIETVVAKKYNGNTEYYDDFIDNKNVIKQQLREKAEPKLLWS